LNKFRAFGTVGRRERSLKKLSERILNDSATCEASWGYVTDGDDGHLMSTVRVLIVDDFAPWRGFVIEHLDKQPHVRVLGYASDGIEGVHKAEELQPDLILLDVGLPKLNGIEMARKVRSLVPKAKILFLSSNNDPDVIRAAFCAGGAGYILKVDAGVALLAGMEAVLLGRQFVSGSLKWIKDLGNLGQ
jgi:DNA-binding NarL/FixJ family response regulator